LTSINRSTYKARSFLDEFEPVAVKCAHASRVARCVTLAAMLLLGGRVLLAETAAAAHDGMRLTDHLYDTHFIDADTGWVVGAFGTIVRTRDGGAIWYPQVSRTVEHLFGVDFSDARNGWIVGRIGTILHTHDGGDTWESQTSGTDQHLFSVTALDAQRAWAVGDFGTILATHDGGKTWEKHSLERDVILNSESWPDADHGWIVGEAGTILATSDAGATWRDQTSGVEKTFFGVCFTDAQHGWVVGLDGVIVRTTDGGQTWDVLHGDTHVSALEQVGYKDAFDNPSLYAIAIVGQDGYAVGDNAGVFVSADGGQTWHRKEMPSEANLRWLRAVTLVKGTRGLLVGANGLAMRIAGDRISVAGKEEHAAEMAH